MGRPDDGSELLDQSYPLSIRPADNRRLRKMINQAPPLLIETSTHSTGTFTKFQPLVFKTLSSEFSLLNSLSLSLSLPASIKIVRF